MGNSEGVINPHSDQAFINKNGPKKLEETSDQRTVQSYTINKKSKTPIVIPRLNLPIQNHDVITGSEKHYKVAQPIKPKNKLKLDAKSANTALFAESEPSLSSTNIYTS